MKDLDKIEPWVWIFFLVGFGLLIFHYSGQIEPRGFQPGESFSPQHVARNQPSSIGNELIEQ